jgi:outer membrane protein TolC
LLKHLFSFTYLLGDDCDGYLHLNFKNQKIVGCAVGPDFKTPAAANESSYTVGPLTNLFARKDLTGGGVQGFKRGGNIAGGWWKLFHSQPLNTLIKQSLAHNPDLKAARAALSVSRENVLAQRGVYLPNIAAGFSGTRHKDLSAFLPPVPSSNAFMQRKYQRQSSCRFYSV